jgi:glycosyltransferase involved in cell wall biosynthesis
MCAIGSPEYRWTWSGTPWSIMTGLRELGVEVVAIDVVPPRLARVVTLGVIAVPQILRLAFAGSKNPVGGALAVARMHPWYLRVCSVFANRRLKRAGHVDAVIQMGTGFMVNHPVVVSYEDMTVAQARSLGNEVGLLTPRQQKLRQAQQSKNYARCAALTFSTEWPAASARTDYGVPSAKVNVIGIGRNYSPAPTARTWQRPHYLFIGKEWIRKGGPQLLEAFARVRKIHPDAQLTLIGEHPQITQDGVTGLGPVGRGTSTQTELFQQVWDSATCLVVPAKSEPAGIVFAEAASAGVPSIGSSVGGARYVIGEAGFVVEPGNVDQLSQRMLELADPGLAAKLGELAKANAVDYSWEAVSTKMLKVLAAAIGEH